MDLDQAIERYHEAADVFARGNPEPVKSLYSHRQDVTLANPFVGPPVRGWVEVSAALDYASSNFRDGRVTSVESVGSYVGSDLASILEIERWEARVGHREDVAPFVLRVTTTFRLEDDSWKVVHRHADPIATPSPDGPLRVS
jgi:ketosteroid isomerase-like protein